MFVLYFFCVLIPLFLTDGCIIYAILHSEWEARQHSMENVANAVQYNFVNSVEHAAEMARNLYINRSLNDFLNREYEDALEYVTAYHEYFQKSLFGAGMIANDVGITFYTDNGTIVRGGRCNSIEAVSDSAWYRALQDAGSGGALFFLYDDSQSPVVDGERKIIFARRMDYYSYNDPYEKLLVLTLNYGNIASDLVKMNYGMPVYVCGGDQILLSNGGNSVRKEFEENDLPERGAYTQDMRLYGAEFMIYVRPPQISALEEIKANMPVIAFLLVINILLPLLLMGEINRSFSLRIGRLSDVFNKIEEEHLIEIEEVCGGDEIGELMGNYNRMVRRVNSLIQTIYIARMKEQEMLVARQNAELLALHSQINPHFLFNALDSIRMHSILKKERETAEMVERLALLQRQCLEWGNDSVPVGEEMAFVTAYLELQKYRFGDRLNYKLEVQEDCADYRIPKLTIATFVENGCVHGIECKSRQGWIFVRIYTEGDSLCLEVEDTGKGMEEEDLLTLRQRMEHASIEMLKDKGRVGIVNACLRLKMMSRDRVSFEAEAESGAGTMIQIRLPLACLEKGEG